MNDGLTNTFQYIRHSDLTLDQMQQIIHLKQQHWKYSQASQIRWLQQNLQPCDIHLLLFKNMPEPLLVGYLVLIEMNIRVGHGWCKAYEVSTVCIDQKCRHDGRGTSLLKEASRYIHDRQFIGILRCDNALRNFYERLGWRTVYYKNNVLQVFVSDKLFSDNVLFLVDEVVFSKNLQQVHLDRFL